MIFDQNPRNSFSACAQNWDVIMPQDAPHSYDSNGGTYVLIRAILMEMWLLQGFLPNLEGLCTGQSGETFGTVWNVVQVT